MPKYKVIVEYTDHTTYQSIGWYEADTEDQAIAEARRRYLDKQFPNLVGKSMPEPTA